MDRYELESLRRSIAMLSPGQAALNREEVLAIIRDVADAQARLRELRAELVRLVERIDG